MSNVYIDIETLPDMDFDKSTIEVKAPANYKKPESIEKWIQENGDTIREEEWRKQALSADRGGRILSIGYSVANGEIKTLYGLETDEHIIRELFDDLSSMNVHPFFIGHNVPFDLEFIWKRSKIQGISCPFKLRPFGRHGSEFYDTMQAWAGFKGHISQDRLASLLGIEQKPSDISGSNVLDHYLAGDHDKIREYNAYDVDTVRKIHKRIAY